MGDSGLSGKEDELAKEGASTSGQGGLDGAVSYDSRNFAEALKNDEAKRAAGTQIADGTKICYDPTDSGAYGAGGLADLGVEQKKVLQLATEKFTYTDKSGQAASDKNALDKFVDHMNRFETRAERERIPISERVDFYKNIEAMLEPKQAWLEQRNRNYLAQDIMYHAADPRTCCEGIYHTCQATSAAIVLFHSNLAKASSIIAYCAVRGNWHSPPDNKEVYIDSKAVLPAGPDEHVRPADLNRRSYAMQILDVALANDITQRRLSPEIYLQGPPDPASHHPTGEYLYRGSGRGDLKEVVVPANPANPSGEQIPVGDPMVRPGEIADLLHRLTGKSEQVIVNSLAQNDKDKQLPDDRKLFHISSPADLNNHIADPNNLPCVLAVDGTSPVLWPEPHANRTSEGHVNHVIVVTGFKNGMVEITNPQKMPGENRTVVTDVNSLYQATLPYRR